MPPETSRTPRNPHAIAVIGGRRFDSWRDPQTVARVSVELVTDQASEATVALFDPKFKILDGFTSGDGVPQLVVLIYLGFGEDLGEPVFKGLLASVERDDTNSIFQIYDMGQKMRQERKGQYHRGIDDLALQKKLANRNGLGFVGPDSAPKLDRHKALKQDSKNDWELSSERARPSGFNRWVRMDTLFVKEPAKIGTPLLSLKYRKDFVMEHELNLRYKLPENQKGRPKVVEHRGRKRGGKRLTGRSRLHPRGTKPVQFTRDPAIHTPTYIGRRADAHKQLQRDPAFNLSITSIPPLPGVRPDVRDTIELLELGRLFSGPYLCDRVNHEFSGSEFKTNYTLYRDIA